MKVKSLYYITNIANLPSLCEQGILSANRIDAEKTQFVSMYKGITDAKNDINRRGRVKPLNGKSSLLGYASLYFQPRNPMMYRAIFETGVEKLAILEVANTVLNEPGVLISDGNATDELTQFYPCVQGLKKNQQQSKVIQSEWWKKYDGSKRKIMAECLVPGLVKPEYIRSIIIHEDGIKIWEKMLFSSVTLPVLSQPKMFFQPNRRIRVGKNITLIDGGDIFCTELHTLTVTVNLQGVMGKGLALRAREQFPDVYVEYENVCRAKKITVERPYIYKREESVSDELTDSKPHRIVIKNPKKWFLLFATKRHWRNHSRMDDIESGLRWVQENSRKEGIQSLAMSALGCALGGLKWEYVAPVMCKYLDKIGIPIEIYLPREYPIEPKHLTEAHLLGP